MGDLGKNEGLEHEAANFFRLGTLLQKERSDLKARLVESVLKEPLSTGEKIQRIVAIDLKPEEDTSEPPRRPRLSGRATDDGEAATVEVDSAAEPEIETAKKEMTAARRQAIISQLTGKPQSNREELEHVRRSRMRNTRNPEPGGIFHYLFSDYRSIRQFGLRSHTIERGGFPFVLKISPATFSYFSKTLTQDIATTLFQGLAPLLRRGWMVLDKEDYNLLSALRSLTQQIIATDLNPNKTEIVSLLAAVSPLSPLLFAFGSNRDLGERTVRAWELVNEKLAISDPIRGRGGTLIRQLLSMDPEGLSLFNIVRAFWMLKTHRLIEYADLVPKHHGSLFCKDSFDCTLDIQEEIDRYIQQLTTKLQAFDKERMEIERLRYYLPRRQNQEQYSFGPSLDFSVLEAFYQGSSIHPDYKFTTDRENLLVWTIRFLDVFLENIGPLLGTGLRLQSHGPSEIFKKGVLSSYTVRLSAMQDALKRYPVTARTVDPKALEDIAETARILTSLGKTIIDLIRNRSLLANPLIRSTTSEEPAYPLPFEGELIGLPDLLAGKTVIDALVLAGRISLISAFFLGDHEFAAQLDRESPLKLQALEIRSKLRQIAVSAQMTEIELAFSPLWQGAET